MPRKPRKAAKRECGCVYDHTTKDVFQEVYYSNADKVDSPQCLKFYTALTHTPEFSAMCNTLNRSFNPVLFSEAIRYGFEMGKRLTEISNLETMVGVGESKAKPKRRRFWPEELTEEYGGE